MYKLFPYQASDLNEVARKMHAQRRVIYCLPTGAGKTVVAAWLMAQYVKAGNRVAFIADRQALVAQASERLAEMGIPHGVVQGPRRNGLGQPVQICSSQTLERRENWPEFQLAIIDEAHVKREIVLRQLAKRGIYVVGLTATPFAKGLGHYYRDIISNTTTNQLLDIEQPRRVLVPVKAKIGREAVVDGGTKNGEWTEKQASRAVTKIVGDVFNDWRRYSIAEFDEPVKTMIFSASIPDGMLIVNKFRANGFAFEQITAQDTYEQKRRKIADLNSGRLLGLVSCTLLERGIDIPTVKCIVMARPYKRNLTGVLQQLGRGMRWAPGKDRCLVVDNSGNLDGFYRDITRFYARGCQNLNTTEEIFTRKEGYQREARTCLNCMSIVLDGGRCTECRRPSKRGSVATRAKTREVSAAYIERSLHDDHA